MFVAHTGNDRNFLWWLPTAKEARVRIADWAAYADLLRPLSPAALAFTAGDRYTQAKIRGADALGAQAWELPFTPGRSTTAALGRLASSL